MNSLDSSTVMILYLVSNAVALLLLFTATKYHRVCRGLFFMLFAWASYTNFTTAIRTPHFYLSYAESSFFDSYKVFINGWFSAHITAVVCLIAAGQAMIAFSMLMRGTLFRIGAAGGIVFLLAIAPLGVGAAFPCTLLMAASLWILWGRRNEYLWIKPVDRQ